MKRVVCVLENEPRKNVCEGEPCERAHYCEYSSICKAKAPQDYISKKATAYIRKK